MVPEVPVPVWQQISIVIVFAFLLAGMGYALMKVFIKAIADINSHYASIVSNNNKQWQTYFDLRGESDKLINAQFIRQLESLTNVVTRLVDDFSKHDLMERQALDEMADKRRLAKKRDPNK